MTDQEFIELSKKWLEPVGEILKQLDEASREMTPEQFASEVQSAIDAIPELFDRLQVTAFEDTLRDEITAAMIAGLRQGLRA